MAAAFDGHALLIGVGRSRYPPWSLPAVSRDIEVLAGVLTDPEHGGYPPDRVESLVDRRATARNILEHLDRLARLAAARPKITAVVYYSGHGWRRGDDYFLIPHDVEPGRVERLVLPARQFTEALRAIQAHRLVVILDTCHAEGMAEVKGRDASGPALAPEGYQEQAPTKKDLLPLIAEGQGRAVLSSCLGSQSSWILPEQQMSVFTYHLVEALRGEGGGENTGTGEGVVMLTQVMTHVSRAVKRTALELGHEQEPYFKIDAADFPIALSGGSRQKGARPDEAADSDAALASLVARVPELAPTRESWEILFDVLRTDRLSTASPAAVTALRQVLAWLGLARPEPRVEVPLRRRFRAAVRETFEPASFEGMARLWLEIAHVLGSAGHFEAAYHARRLCRRVVEQGTAEGTVTDRLRELGDGLINNEAVAMRDELQPALALGHLNDYEVPRKAALLYNTVRVLGTKAQLLTYLAEIEPNAAVARRRLAAAEATLRAVIAYLARNPETAADLPREHNYLAAVHGARGALERMDQAFETALELNDRWFEALASDAREERRDAWTENILFTFQLWLRYCDVSGDDERFERIDRRYGEARLRIVAGSGCWDAMTPLDRRFPAALIPCYRARVWARKLAPLRGSAIWEQQVSGPLASVLEVFEREEPDGLLAAAVLVDLLLLAGDGSGLVGRARLLEERLATASAASRRHWRHWEQNDASTVNPLYREPLADELRQLRAFLDGRLPWAELEHALRSLRVQLGY